MPEPLGHLSRQAVSMQARPFPDSGRWLVPAIGQADKELPLVLFAVIGQASALDLDPSSRS